VEPNALERHVAEPVQEIGEGLSVSRNGRRHFDAIVARANS
jgi:hypothetical protein